MVCKFFFFLIEKNKGAFLLVTQSTRMSFYNIFLAFNGETKIERDLCQLVSLNGKHPKNHFVFIFSYGLKWI